MKAGVTFRQKDVGATVGAPKKRNIRMTCCLASVESGRMLVGGNEKVPLQAWRKPKILVFSAFGLEQHKSFAFNELRQICLNGGISLFR
jgi:hypothetical protein